MYHCQGAWAGVTNVSQSRQRSSYSYFMLASLVSWSCVGLLAVAVLHLRPAGQDITPCPEGVDVVGLVVLAHPLCGDAIPDGESRPDCADLLHVAAGGCGHVAAYTSGSNSTYGIVTGSTTFGV